MINKTKMQLKALPKGMKSTVTTLCESKKKFKKGNYIFKKWRTVLTN